MANSSQPGCMNRLAVAGGRSPNRVIVRHVQGDCPSPTIHPQHPPMDGWSSQASKLTPAQRPGADKIWIWADKIWIWGRRRAERIFCTELIVHIVRSYSQHETLHVHRAVCCAGRTHTSCRKFTQTNTEKLTAPHSQRDAL